MRASICIDRPRRAVYEFVATPRTWALWRPGRVSIAGVQSRLAWEVTARKAPERVSMAARVPRRGEAALEFSLARSGRGTLLECEIAYDGVNLLVDALHVRPRILAEAKTSLARLKQALESDARR